MNPIPLFILDTAAIPVPIPQDADDDRLEEPRSRVHHDPRPALPLAA